MGTYGPGDRRGSVCIFQGRRGMALLALLLIEISVVIYSLHSTAQINYNTHFDNPEDSVTGSQYPQGPSPPFSSQEEFPYYKSAGADDALNAFPEEPPVTESPEDSNVTPPMQNESTSGPSLTPLGGGVPLRVMFLGASVTRGAVSVGNLGYRSPLRDKLATLGNPINFVGSQRLGAFKDNDLEAYSGNRIDQIHDHSTRIVPKLKPNVFVLHIGSNDCLEKHDTGNAGKRMRDLIAYLFEASPQATVIMSSLLTNTASDMEPCVLDLNIQIRELASALQREGRPVVFAEMHCEQGLPGRPIPADISPDGIHPFDHGYRLMADIFFSAFLEADRRGLLRSPEENGVPDDGELDRADEPLVFEMPPPKKQPGYPPAKEAVQVEKTAEDEDIPPKPAPGAEPPAST